MTHKWNIVEDSEQKEHINVDAMESALNALEIVIECYNIKDLEFVDDALNKLRLALNTCTREELG